jgi:hypothetical protein
MDGSKRALKASPAGRRRRTTVIAVLAATAVSAVAQPTAARADSVDWHSYVLGPSTPQVAPVGVDSRGKVSHPNALVRGKGQVTELTTVAGQTPASVLLDFGEDVGGTPYIDVTAATGTPTLSLVTGEARGFLRKPAATSVAAEAAAGAAQVKLASTNGLEVGDKITFGTGSDAQTRTITAFDTASATVSFTPALSQALSAKTAVSTALGAPASDESPGLAGVGGPDTLTPGGKGRVTAKFHGGFRFVLLTLTTPGTVSISGAGVDFQAFRAAPQDYAGWFLSSDRQLNKMWYSGAYTVQLDMKPAGLNGLPDARIYDGAKRDRSIWTGDLIVQEPAAVTTLGDAGAAYAKSSLDVMLANQRADGALPGSPDFSKGRNPAGSAFFYSNNYSEYGARAVIDYYRYTGDETYIRSALPALRRELAYNATFVNSDNLVVSNDRDYWQATQTGEVTKYSVDYYALLRDMAWIERKVGSATAAADYDSRAEAVKTAINARLWNPRLGAYGQSSDNPDRLVEDANAAALQYGIVPAEHRASVLTTLKNLWTPYGAILGPGLADPTGHTIEPYGNGMETAGRFAAGDTAGALDLMRRTWGQMVDKDDPLYTGAFWEFKNNSGGVNRTTASLAHGWAASPTVQLTQQILGITPVDPGYASWSIKPQPGTLKWSKGAVPTKYGTITADWTSSPHTSSFELNAQTPAGAHGTISVPADGKVVVTVNGKTAWNRGASEAYDAHAADGYVTLTVPGGDYHVTVTHG